MAFSDHTIHLIPVGPDVHEVVAEIADQTIGALERDSTQLPPLEETGVLDTETDGELLKGETHPRFAITAVHAFTLKWVRRQVRILRQPQVEIFNWKPGFRMRHVCSLAESAYPESNGGERVCNPLPNHSAIDA